jgi:hypothetical protein
MDANNSIVFSISFSEYPRMASLVFVSRRRQQQGQANKKMKREEKNN